MPNDTVPAAATGLPSHRRGFLRDLLTLPLIGGGVTLIGNPTAAAEPNGRAARQLRERHRGTGKAHRLAAPFVAQMAGWDGCDLIPHGNAGARFHRADGPAATTRAALVLSAVGCDWRRA